ncbi:MAG TPA: ASCH domain-containing protein [Citricoccus sp.]
MPETADDVLTAFWAWSRAEHPGLPVEVPEAWAFGATPEHADGLLELVLDGTKTATSSALWDHEATGEPVPRPGDLSIILDGAGRPRAVLETTAVEILPFGEVSEEHARAEGEGERTLAAWRAIHERYWRRHAQNPRGFDPAMPVVCERFRLLHADTPNRASGPR